jgi:hypothetical protein
MGFTKSETCLNLYLILVGEDPLILVFYIDDLFLIGVEDIISGCKEYLSSDFKMKHISLMHYFFF